MVANIKKSASSTPGGETSVTFLADCPSAVALDDLVYVTGPTVSGIAQVDVVDITDSGTMPAIGIVTERPTATRCTIVTLGEVNPTLSLSPGKRYFASTTGTITELVPTPAGQGAKAMVQVIGYAITADRLIMMPSLLPIRKLG